MPRREVVLTDEERQRRRERMLELRAKLAQVKGENTKSVLKEKVAKKIAEEEEKPKTIPAVKPPKSKPVIETVSESDESDDDDDVAELPPKRMPAKKQPVKQKTPVVKKVSIKYYGKVSKEEVDNDARLVEQLHRQDNEFIERKKSNKKKTAEAEATAPPPALNAEDLMMKRLFGL